MDRWSELILGDLPDFPNNGNADLFGGRLNFTYTGYVYDVVVGAQLEDFTNITYTYPGDCNRADVVSYCGSSRIIGSGGPSTSQRFNGDSTTFNTVAGTVRLERLNFLCCDEDTDRRLTILHEIGHVLGIGIFDSSGASFDTGTPLSFQRFCRQDPQNNNVLANYNSFVPNPPTSVTYWNGVDSNYKNTTYKGGQASMEDCVAEGCGGGSNCSHWDIEMFPSNPPGDFQQAQELMAYASRDNWAQVITGLSLGILADVGYDDGANVRVDFSKADPYPTPNGFTNRGESNIIIARKYMDWSMMLDEDPPTIVERTRP